MMKKIFFYACFLLLIGSVLAQAPQGIEEKLDVLIRQNSDLRQELNEKINDFPSGQEINDNFAKLDQEMDKKIAFNNSIFFIGLLINDFLLLGFLFYLKFRGFW